MVKGVNDSLTPNYFGKATGVPAKPTPPLSTAGGGGAAAAKLISSHGDDSKHLSVDTGIIRKSVRFASKLEHHNAAPRRSVTGLLATAPPPLDNLKYTPN